MVTKKIFSFLENLPDGLSRAINNRAAAILLLSVTLITTTLFTGNLILIIFSFMMTAFLWSTLLHILYLIKKDRLLYVKGICTELRESKLLRHSSACFVIFEANGCNYRCAINHKVLKKLKEGMFIAIYATERSILQDTHGCVQITYPVFFLSSYKDTDI